MIVFAPIVEFPGDKFRSVIHPNHLRQSATFFELIQYTDHAQRRQAGVGFDPEYLAVVVIHHIEHAKDSPIPYAVMHKYRTQYLIHTLWLDQLLFSSCWQSFLSPTANIKLQGRIDPIYPFVIPTVAHRSNPMITLPEANGRVFGG